MTIHRSRIPSYSLWCSHGADVSKFCTLPVVIIIIIVVIVSRRDSKTMNLFCAESQNNIQCDQNAVTWSTTDVNVLTNPRVIRTLLDTEDAYAVKCDYMKKVQTDVTENNRKVLTSWMTEVCEAECCEDVVIPLATNYMDRFLCHVNVSRDQFQTLGSVCLLLASKLRQCRAFTVDQMAYYTDYSCTAQDIMNWELLVLNKLGWDVSSVTSNDFLDHILYRLPLSEQHIQVVKKHSQVFITLCCTEYEFSHWKPSTLACASIAAAADGLSWLQKPWKSLQQLLDILHDITDIDPIYLRVCVQKIEELVKIGLATLQQSEEDSNKQSSKLSTSSSNSSISSGTKYGGCLQSQPETPTDLTDVMF